MIDHLEGVNAVVVSLVRRSQLLIEQQQQLLDELHRQECDPDRLATLARLEHVTTRLRRHDENLLVLAGASGRRRSGAAMPLAEILLAALSEIHQYERVRVAAEEGVIISDYVVADLVRLFAELIDNAVDFSPPDAPVRVIASRDDAGATVDIIDSGIGFGVQALSEANGLLEKPPPLSAGAAERMGLAVVSHLAARHGLRVHMRPGATGTHTNVRIPGALVSEGGRA